jgi:hypothetical protein
MFLVVTTSRRSWFTHEASLVRVWDDLLGLLSLICNLVVFFLCPLGIGTLRPRARSHTYLSSNGLTCLIRSDGYLRRRGFVPTRYPSARCGLSGVHAWLGVGSILATLSFFASFGMLYIRWFPHTMYWFGVCGFIYKAEQNILRSRSILQFCSFSQESLF